jgi:hypothetical protein
METNYKTIADAKKKIEEFKSICRYHIPNLESDQSPITVKKNQIEIDFIILSNDDCRISYFNDKNIFIKVKKDQITYMVSLEELDAKLKEVTL